MESFSLKTSTSVPEPVTLDSLRFRALKNPDHFKNRLLNCSRSAKSWLTLPSRDL